MNDEDVKESSDDDDDVDADVAAAQKRALILIGSVLLFVVGGITSAYFTGLLDPLLRSLSGGDDRLDYTLASMSEPTVTYYDLPESMVNINSEGKPVFLKINISVELKNEDDVAAFEYLMPRITDKFQVYLRGLRLDDLEGARGMHRLREELLERVSLVVRPIKVNSVLFKEITLQ